MFYQSIKHNLSKKHVLLFSATLPLHHKANGEAQALHYAVIKHSKHLRTLEKSRKHSPAARVLSQCNTRLGHFLFVKFWIHFDLFFLCV